MLPLILVSVLWALSFGLIKGKLTGLDPAVVALIRLGLSAVVFVPLLRPSVVGAKTRWRLAGVGAIQYGVMYSLYIASYRYLAAHQVALFTSTTPLYVVLLDDLWGRRWRPRALVAALLAAGGAVIVVFHSGGRSSWLTGLLLVQGANMCFALGQLAYRALARAEKFRHRDVFGWMYLGAVAVAGVSAAWSSGGGVPHVTPEQWCVLVYLGVVSSALGFFLWNVGASRVSTGVLAVFNNIKVPLAVLASVVVFRERVDWIRLLAGGGAMAAGLWLVRERPGQKP